MKKEKWRPLPDEKLKDLYLVSNLGRIKSLNGRDKKIKILTLFFNIRRGYFYVRCQNKKYIKNFIVHRLVAKAFVYNPDPKIRICVDHKDFNRKNNNANNLEWVTHKENTSRAIKAGRIKKAYGIRSPLKEKDVIKMRLLHSKGVSQKILAQKYSIKPCSVSLIINKKRWRHI